MTVRSRMPPPCTAPAVAVRTFPYGFGSRFFALLAGGFVLIIPAWIDPRLVVAVIGWNLLVLIIWLLDLRRIPSGAALEVTREWSSPLGLGASSRVQIEVKNRTALPIRTQVIDDVPAALRPDLPEVELQVGAVATGVAEYEILPAERGDARLGRLWLRVRSPWSVAERWLAAAVEQTVRVFPDLDEARRQSMFLLRSRQVALEKRRVRLVGLGRDFESLRDYQPGDEVRDICWTVTARRAKPVTKVYQPERSQAVWILVDAGRLLRARVGNRTKLDGMVNAAVGLADVALAAGDRVGLLAYGRGIHARLAPDRGAQQLRTIVDALATLRADRAEADHAGAAAAFMAAQKRRALVVWLTDVAETAGVPDVIESAARLSPGHVVVFGLTKPMELTKIEDATPATDDDMYRMLAVHETLDRRELLLRGLRQRGVHVLEMDPAAPTAMLIDQYLTVKERNLI